MKDNIINIENNLKNIEHKIKDCENELIEKKRLMEDLQSDFELTLMKYNLYKNQEIDLRNKLFTAEKEYFKTLIGVDGIKKIFNKSEPLISKIKDSALNKKEHLRNYLQSKQKKKLNLSKKWIESFSFHITKSYTTPIDTLYENYIHYLLENKYSEHDEYILDESQFIVFLEQNIKNAKFKNKLTNISIS